jgi:hypothetical protein
MLDFAPLIPTFSLKGEGADTCLDTYALMEKGQCGNSATTLHSYTAKKVDSVHPKPIEALEQIFLPHVSMCFLCPLCPSQDSFTLPIETKQDQ